uniref:Uncharacterized protein n=1 Tax=Arundo donax TaxID=35708 RepID=A0A0A9BYH3_ARUDO
MYYGFVLLFCVFLLKLVLMYLNHFSFIFDSLFSVVIHLWYGYFILRGLDCDHSSH